MGITWDSTCSPTTTQVCECSSSREDGRSAFCEACSEMVPLIYEEDRDNWAATGRRRPQKATGLVSQCIPNGGARGGHRFTRSGRAIFRRHREERRLLALVTIAFHTATRVLMKFSRFRAGATSAS